jgi:hypothetical protein
MNTAKIYAEGINLVRSGKLKEAEPLILSVIEKDGRYLKINRSDDIDDYLVRRVSSPADAETAWHSYRVAHRLFNSRKYTESAAWFTQTLAILGPPENATRLWKASANFLLLSNFESSEPSALAENRRFVKDWATRFPNDAWFILARAALNFLSGHHEKATRLIVEARNNIGQNEFPLPAVQHPIFSVLPWEDSSYDDLENEAAGKPFEWQLDISNRHNPDAPVHFCAADAKYFEKFAEAVTASAAANKYRGTIHLHIVNPTSSTRDVRERIANRHPDLAVNYSYSTHHDTADQRPYFASVRFLAARSIMDLYGSDIIISDIDVSLSGQADELARGVDGADVAVRIRPRRNYFPWKRVIVNLMYIRRTEQNRRLLNYVAAYYHRVEGASGQNPIWGVDQSAFFYALTRAQHLNLRVQNLNELDYRYVSFAANNKVAWAKKVAAS